MQIKNVHYSERPDRFIITARGSRALIEFPTNITEIEKDEGVEYKAETVYFLETKNTQKLDERISTDFDLWLEAAKVPEPQVVNLGDVVEALNALAEVVIGG